MYGVPMYDASVMHFTGKEHDSESGLDYFGARYYSGNQGRFQTPDWADTATTVPYASFGDPQSLNLYAYVRNNPTTMTDPGGHAEKAAQSSDGQTGCMRSVCPTMEQDLKDKKKDEQKSEYDSSKNGPEDPTNPGKPLYENSAVKRASDDAFMKTVNGTAREGLAEAGFAIEYKNGKVYTDHKVDSVYSDGKPNELHIPTDSHTIAILHTHGNKGVGPPSEGDRQSKFPNFVRTKSELYVTVPGTSNYIQLIPRQKGADQ